MSKGTTVRSVRIDDETWTAAQAEAKRQGITVSELIRRALVALLLVAFAAMLGGCGGGAVAAPAPAVEWNGTHGLTADDARSHVAEALAASADGLEALEDPWSCALPMTVHIAAAPGVDRSAVARELDYPIATLRALGYDVTLGADAAYRLDAQTPDTYGQVDIVVASNVADQPDLTPAGEAPSRAIAQMGTDPDETTNVSASVVLDAKRGLGADIILHELGHVLGLDHKDGTVMASTGEAPVAFDAAEVAAVACR